MAWDGGKRGVQTKCLGVNSHTAQCKSLCVNERYCSGRKDFICFKKQLALEILDKTFLICPNPIHRRSCLSTLQELFLKNFKLFIPNLQL